MFAPTAPTCVELTDTPPTDLEPDWSPDGSKIVFASNRPIPGDTVVRKRLWIMDADGSNPTQFTAAVRHEHRRHDGRGPPPVVVPGRAGDRVLPQPPERQPLRDGQGRDQRRRAEVPVTPLPTTTTDHTWDFPDWQPSRCPDGLSHGGDFAGARSTARGADAGHQRRDPQTEARARLPRFGSAGRHRRRRPARALAQPQPQAHRLITRRSGGHAGDTIVSAPRTASRAGAKLRRLTARHAECIPRVPLARKVPICRHFSCRRRDSNTRHEGYSSGRTSWLPTAPVRRGSGTRKGSRPRGDVEAGMTHHGGMRLWLVRAEEDSTHSAQRLLPIADQPRSSPYSRARSTRPRPTEATERPRDLVHWHRRIICSSPPPSRPDAGSGRATRSTFFGGWERPSMVADLGVVGGRRVWVWGAGARAVSISWSSSSSSISSKR